MFQKIMELGIAELLRAAWIAGILPIIVASIPSSRLRLFHGLLLQFARRGKVLQSSSHKFTVPQRFFLHFYVVAVTWTTFLLLITWSYGCIMIPLDSEALQYSTTARHLTEGSNVFSRDKPYLASIEQRKGVWRIVFLLVLMELQVFRRLYETICVFNYSPSARMHIFGYLTGIFFYVAAPLSLCSTRAPELLQFATNQAVELNLRDWDKMQNINFSWWQYVKPLEMLVWYQWVGAAIFIWGWIHQLRCHAILGSLRKQKKQATDYVIPHGDWFELVSSPHYLAEIVIYAGLLAASGGSDLTIWLLFGFVVANLAFAATETQRWYLCKFDTYPPNRQALFPGAY